MKRSSLLELAGWIGTIIILLSYILLSTGAITSDWRYHSLIFIGSLGVAAISFAKKAWQPFTLNMIFCILAIVAIIRLL